jgi:four helix bundle protein
MNEESQIRTFRDLKVWKKGMAIAKLVYQFTEKLPQSEKFGLVSQMRRAAVSLPSNIAEGFRRRHPTDYRRFLHMALGSAAELEVHVELCEDLHASNGPASKELLVALNHFQAMTMSLIRKLERSIDENRMTHDS